MLEKGTTLNKILYNTALRYTRYRWTMCEKYPNTDFFVVGHFPHSYWIWRDTPYLSVFSPNAGKYRAEKIPYLDTFHTVGNDTITSD